MAQMAQIKKLGPMSRVMGMIPGMSELTKSANMDGGEVEKQMSRMQAIYDSMSKKERGDPDVLDGPRRRRVAAGAGVEPREVGQFMKQFEMSRGMMKAVGGMGMGGRMRLMKGLMGGGLQNMGMPGGPSMKVKGSGPDGEEGPQQEGQEAAVARCHGGFRMNNFEATRMPEQAGV